MKTVYTDNDLGNFHTAYNTVNSAWHILLFCRHRIEQFPTSEEGKQLVERANQVWDDLLRLLNILSKFKVAAVSMADDGWHPIETAPKDGTKIIAYAKDIYGGDAEEINTTFWNSGRWAYFSSHFPPTHWQHIPKAPA